VTWLQHWTDVLFLHFAVPAGDLRGHVPAQLEIDTFEGRAWLSLVLFRLKLRPWGLPFVPGFSSLLELNVRTYVRHRGQAGICFLKMYADNRLAIRAARWLTPLCYEQAAMIDRRLPDSRRHVACRPARNPSLGLSMDFTVAGNAAEASPGSLNFWLVERYRLFVGIRDGSILAGDVEHPPWQISNVELLALKNRLGVAMALPLGDVPAAVSFSTGTSARFNSFHVVDGSRSRCADGSSTVF
jgi:uncharacterized protein YqjF (DUF2071 family)